MDAPIASRTRFIMHMHAKEKLIVARTSYACTNGIFNRTFILKEG
jgi:hypothetical protein